MEEIRFLLFLKEIFSNFADSRPEERRVIFEEAAGVSKYKKRKIEAIRKLERTTDNLNRIKDIVYELEKQIAPIKKTKRANNPFSYHDKHPDSYVCMEYSK